MTKTYIQNKNCEASCLENEWIILNTDNFTVTKVNEVGGFCWSLLQEAQTVESVVDSLKKQFVDAEKMKREEIENFLMELEGCGVIQDVR